ncbi:Ectopic P granules protein 5 [Bulinus truncatus]|nr:Ectopic P granules protein 5 [Bulinus truncatus]
MIKTLNMAEAVRPKHRKQTKPKKVKPVLSDKIKAVAENEVLTETQSHKDNTETLRDESGVDTAKFDNTNSSVVLPDEMSDHKDLISTFISKDLSEASGELSETTCSDHTCQLEDASQATTTQSVTPETHCVPQRPQHLPPLTISPNRQQLDPNSNSDETAGLLQKVILPHDNAHPDLYKELSSFVTTGVLPSPAVVEDPNTPMSRTVSPSPKTIKEEIKISPTVPPIVLEEKSPNLLAQEALARLQNLNISGCSSAESSKAISPTKTENIITSHVSENISDQHVQLTHHPQSVNKRKISSPKFIYPSDQLEQSKETSKTHIGPMSLSELLSLYYNPELANNDRFIEEFTQKEIKKENHEFYEILSNYFRARRQLLSVEEDIKTLQKNCTALQKEVWITHVKSVSVQGTCADQARVFATHTYEQSELIQDNLLKIGSVLENIRMQICDNLSLFAYTSQISRLQVESYIHNLYLSCPTFRNMPKNTVVSGRREASVNEQYDIQRLKDCISVLFAFHRKPIPDTEFVTNLRQWTVRLISFLLRVATYSDHLFILNHLLRCPSGVGKWAAELVQYPCLQLNSSQYQSNFSCPVLNHIITSIATVLLPVKAREEFMHQMQINFSEQGAQEDRAWILVDSDGEEESFISILVS